MNHRNSEAPCPSGTKRVVLFLSLFLFLLPFFAGADYAPFALISDTHIRSYSSVYATFIRAVEQRKIEMIIHTGDVIDNPGSSGQWTRFFEMTGPGKKLHVAPGNHDIQGKGSLAVYLKFFPTPYYSFCDGDTLFLLLNTELPGQESMVAGEQLAWLQTELERPFRYKLVFLHEPLFPLLPLHGLDRHQTARDALHGLFVKNGVSLVVSGHDHLYHRSTKDGITYVIAGGGGGQLLFFLKNGNFFHWIMATRTNDRYLFIVRDMEGKERDRFSVIR